jgi:ABC-type branched-subunit amino acid transport system substrate-binding protein
MGELDGCTRPLRPSPIRTAAASVARLQDNLPLELGFLEDRPGEIALLTLPKLRGAQLALEKIDKSGGIDGRQL